MRNSRGHSQANLLQMSSSALVVAHLMFVACAALFIATGFRGPTYLASALLLVAASIYTALSFMEGKNNIGCILAAQCALWYVLPLSYAWVIAPPWFQSTIDTAIVVNIFVTSATLIVFTVCKLIGPVHQIHPMKAANPNVAIAMGVLSSVLIGYLMLKGEWGYRIGDDTIESSQSILLALTTGTGLAIAPLCAYLIGAASSQRASSIKQTIALGTVSLFHVYAWIPMQRRQLAIMLILMLVAYLSARFKHQMNLSVLLRASAGFVALIPVIYVLWQIFFQIRVMSYSLSGGDTISIGMFFSDSTAFVGDTSSDFQENLLERPFITASVETIHRTQLQYLYGENLYTSLIGALPSALFPWKNMILFYAGGMGEVLWMVKGMVPFSDYANTIFLDSIVDFGYFGPFIYFPIFTCFIHGLCSLARHLREPTWQVFFFYMLCVFSVSIEASPTALFVFGRNALIAMVGFFIITRLIHTTGSRLRHKAVRPRLRSR